MGTTDDDAAFFAALDEAELHGRDGPQTPEAVIEQPTFKPAVSAALEAYQKALHPEVEGGGASVLEIAVLASATASCAKAMVAAIRKRESTR